MALHITTQADHDIPTVEVVGIPLNRRPTLAPAMAALQTEVERLRELLIVKDSHIATLETQVWAWRSQANNELKARRRADEVAHERERDLVRILHRQVLRLQDLEEREASRRHWWHRHTA